MAQSDIVKLVAPVSNGNNLVQSSGGIWYLDGPGLLVKTDASGAIVNETLEAAGYPTVDDCAGPRAKMRTQHGVIFSHPDIDCQPPIALSILGKRRA